MTRIAKFVGLDVHKDTIAIAVSEGGPISEARDLGVIPHDVPKLIKRLLSLASVEDLFVVYEAGPTGFGLCRELGARGIQCIVVAPNRVPQMPGARIKTDKRDARHLAFMLRTNSLSGITIPDEELEALRDLVRAREDAVRARRRARQQLSMFLLRHGRHWRGKSGWSLAHLNWIRTQRFGSEAQKLVLTHCMDEVIRLGAAIERLTEDVDRIAGGLSGLHGKLYRSVQALRGVSTIVAATLVCELGDLRRFERPSRLMSYVGMVPSEHSSGPRVFRGAITKTGNPHVRRVLLEAAWSGRLWPNKTLRLQRRQRGLDPRVIEIAWKAQNRLRTRYLRMRARGKGQNITIVAMARELLGFIWAIGQEVGQQAA
jgi:transposase